MRPSDLRAPLVARLRPGLRAFLASSPSRQLRHHVLGALGEGRLEVVSDLIEQALGVAADAERPAFYRRLHALERDDPAALAYSEGIYRTYRARFAQALGSLEGQRVLELGPGHTLVPGLLLYAGGAARYAAVDLDPLASERSELYRDLRARLATPPLHQGSEVDPRQADMLRRFDRALDLTQDHVRFTPGCVDYLTPVNAASMPFEAQSFDALFSHAAMEHFDDPAASIHETARVLSEGGVAFHQIDLRDHREGATPREFLRLSESAWSAELRRPNVSYTNRWRQSRFLEAFEASFHEVEVRHATRLPLEADELASFDPAFRRCDPDDLEVVSTLIVARRPRR